MPPDIPKYAYGIVSLTKLGQLLDMLDVFTRAGPVESIYPLTFEEMNQYFGFMLYRTRLKKSFPQPTPLISPLNGVNDRAYVFVNGVRLCFCCFVYFSFPQPFPLLSWLSH
uniref:Beta-galactosidase-like n=1 Tax=Callorhinchus milii TaxID=7868 RepID=A0A4W3GNN8_CALMI|eukprot:gi/632991482/ref/XP_007884648.1/ PREDICTED: beta-galactosidase-like [Callorhinchus milii]